MMNRRISCVWCLCKFRDIGIFWRSILEKYNDECEYLVCGVCVVDSLSDSLSDSILT
jgi:hypothetical protein